MRRRLLALALVLSAVTACGGDEGSSQDGLSKEEFIAQGDAICEKLNEEGEAVPQPTAEEGTGEYLTTLIGLAKGTRDDLAALAPPSDAQRLHTDMVGAYDSVVELLESAVSAAEGGDAAAAEEKVKELAERAEAAEVDGKSVAQRVDEYGFESCGADI